MSLFTTQLRSLATAAALALAILVGCGAAPTLAQTPTEQIVIDHCTVHLKKLKDATPAAQTQVKKLRSLVNQMLNQYDQIITMGPGSERRELASLYELERPAAVAHKANLDTLIRQIEPKIMPAMDWLEKYLDYRHLPAWKELSNLVFNAQLAAIEAKRIVPPPALPDPLPEQAVSAVEVMDVSMPRKIVVDESNEFTATFRCNRKFTPAKVTVEARVRGGPGKLLDPPTQTIEIGPQATLTLTWRFTATAPGDVKIGARVNR